MKYLSDLRNFRFSKIATANVVVKLLTTFALYIFQGLKRSEQFVFYVGLKRIQSTL